MRIDSHAHVFRRGLPLVRHAPQRDALLPELLATFEAHAIGAGVTYARALRWFDQWVPKAAARDRILGGTPRARFRFDNTSD